MKPILFSTPMVQAILDGRKTMTRRVMKLPKWLSGTYDDFEISEDDYLETVCDNTGCMARVISQYQPGDILWVRETWYRNYPHEYGRYWYRADGEEIDIPLITGGTRKYGSADGLKWRPSIFMPFEAARIFLRVTNVRAERLQDITVEDVISEGLPADNEIRNPDPATHDDIKYWNLVYAHRMFSKPWDNIYEKLGYGWYDNPWVWVISFERIDKSEAVG